MKDKILWYEYAKRVDLEDVVESQQEGSSETSSTLDLELFILQELSPWEVELLIFKSVGYKPREIRQMMRLRKLWWYNDLSARLKKSLLEFAKN